MKDTKYAYAVAYIKTFENKMLTNQDMENLLNSPDMESALKILADKGYGKDLASDTDTDKLLKDELEKTWTEAKNCCPGEAPLEILLYKNDFHNLKTILKSIISDVPFENMLLKPSVSDPYKIEEAIKNKDFQILDDFIKDYAKKAYEIVTSTGDGQLLEIYLDKSLLEEMMKKAESEKNEFLKGWVNLNILIADFTIAVRAIGKNKKFIEDAMIKDSNGLYEKLVNAAIINKNEVISVISSCGYPDAAECLSKSFSDFEKWCDNKKMDYIRGTKQKCFGFEPILGFLIGKEYELQAVRIILNCKINNVPNEIVRERLRDLYV